MQLSMVEAEVNAKLAQELNKENSKPSRPISRGNFATSSQLMVLQSELTIALNDLEAKMDKAD